MDWKYRNSYNSLEELMTIFNSNGLEFSDNINFLPENELEELFFQFIELILNLINLKAYLTPMIKNDLIDNSREGKPFKHIFNSIEDLIAKYNLEVKEVDEKFYVNKKNIENIEEIITDEDVLNEIYKYRSPSIQGNLIEKQKILCILGTYIDKFKKENGKLADLKNDAEFLLNKFEIRHSIDKKAVELITSDEEKEKIYDLTFNRILKYLSYKHYSKEDEHFNEIKDKFK